MGKIRFNFKNIQVGSVVAHLVLERDKSPHEISVDGTGDLEVDVDPSLLIELPSVEEIEEGESGGAIATEIQFKLLDTFQDGFIYSPNNEIGVGSLTSGIIHREYNFSLYNLMFIWDIDAYTREEDPKSVYPPEMLSAKLYINGVHKHTFKLDLKARTGEELALYGKEIIGDFLATFDFYRYDAAEKVFTFVGIEEVKWGIDQVDPMDPKTWRDNDLRETDINGVEHGYDIQWDYDSPVGNSLKPATIATTSNIIFNEQFFHSWESISIERIIRRMIYLGLGGSDDYTVECERSLWKYNPAGIPTDSFIERSDLAGRWRPYFCKRENLIDENVLLHNQVTKFSLIKERDDDEEIRIHRSFVYEEDHILGQDAWENIDNSGRPYAMVNWENGWQIISRVTHSHGYTLRIKYKDEKPHFVFKNRTLLPPLVTIPAFIENGSKINPFDERVDQVKCKPYGGELAGGWGDYVPIYHVFSSPAYQTTDMNFTLTAKLIEPAYDKTHVILGWENDTDYHGLSQAQVVSNEPRITSICVPARDQESKFIFETNSYYGLFGNIMTLAFGHELQAKMQPEFVWIPLGSTMEWQALGHHEGGGHHYSPYPGLMMVAGKSPDYGKTINNTLTTGYDYYRGVGSIELPWGAPNADGTYTYKKFYSGLEAVAAHIYQFKGGIREHRTLTLPTLSEYENENGETGWDAIYPGLRIRIYNRDFKILRCKKNLDADNVEIDVLEIVLPEDITPIERVTHVGCGHDVWEYGPKYSWRGKNDPRNWEEKREMNHNGECACGSGGGGGGTPPVIPPEIFDPPDTGTPTTKFREITGQTSPHIEFVDPTETITSLEIYPDGSIKQLLAGSGLYMKQGANATFGTAILAGGSVTVNTNKITNSSVVLMNHQTVIGGPPGILTVGARIAGTSFVINSLAGGGGPAPGDNSIVSWLIIEPS